MVGVIAYLASEAGYRAVARYIASFENLYDRLAEHPDSGAPRPALGANIRIGLVSPYLIIYEHDAKTDTVTILRIVHGRRKITGALLQTDIGS
jgi:plasmid stabilization system protein ParE